MPPPLDNVDHPHEATSAKQLPHKNLCGPNLQGALAACPTGWHKETTLIWIRVFCSFCVLN